METQHTPGSWSVNDWPQGDAEIRIGATGTPRIATVHLRDVSANEQKGNARLIAAAPDLLEACKAAAHALTWDHKPTDDTPEGRAIVALDAAIAKALG